MPIAPVPRVSGITLDFEIDNPPTNQPNYDASNVGVNGVLANVNKS